MTCRQRRHLALVTVQTSTSKGCVSGSVLIGNKPMGFFEIRYLLLTARVVLQHYCKQALMAVYVAKAA